MHYPDDARAATLLVDNRRSNRVSTEVEVGGLLIDYADPAFREFWMAGKTLACD
jgi:hypothetical protein